MLHSVFPAVGEGVREGMREGDPQGRTGGRGLFQQGCRLNSPPMAIAARPEKDGGVSTKPKEAVAEEAVAEEAAGQ